VCIPSLLPPAIQLSVSWLAPDSTIPVVVKCTVPGGGIDSVTIVMTRTNAGETQGKCL
jgi:hypothetical protein